MSRRELVPTVALTLLTAGLAAFGHLNARTLVAIALVPMVLLGMHYRERWTPRAQAVFFAFVCGASIVFAAVLARLISRNVDLPPEWDFVGFWLHARTAVLGLNFYDPHNAQQLASAMQLSDSFRREIVDVGFWYPPPSMFLFWSLGWFEPRTALRLWYVFQGALLAATILLLWRRFLVRRSMVELFGCATLVGAAYGTWLNFIQSQTTFAALLALLLCWPRRRSATGGVWMALACLVKPFMGILVLVPALGRAWRVTVAFALAIFTATLLSIAAFGWHTFVNYFTTGPVGTKPDWVFSEPSNQSLLALILRSSGSQSCGSACVSNPVFLTAAGLLGSVTMYIGLRIKRPHDEWALALWLVFALLVYPASQTAYSVVLIPLLLLLWRERERVRGGAWAVAMGSGAIYGLMIVGDGKATVVAYITLWIVFALIGTKVAWQPAIGASTFASLAPPTVKRPPTVE